MQVSGGDDPQCARAVSGPRGSFYPRRRVCVQVIVLHQLTSCNYGSVDRTPVGVKRPLSYAAAVVTILPLAFPAAMGAQSHCPWSCFMAYLKCMSHSSIVFYAVDPTKKDSVAMIV